MLQASHIRPLLALSQLIVDLQGKKDEPMPDAAAEGAPAENGGPADAAPGPGPAEAAAAEASAAAPGAADGPAPMEMEAEAAKVEEPKEEVVKKKRTKKLQVPFKVQIEGLSEKVVQVSAHPLPL